RATGRAHASDYLAGAHALAFLDVDRGKVAVAGREPVAMVDLDHLAVAAAPPRLDDGAGGRGADRLAGLAAEVEAGVHRRNMQERIDAHAEARRGVDVAGHGLAHRHARERAGEAVDLAAGGADAQQLTFEGDVLGRDPGRHERAADGARRAERELARVEPQFA